MEDVTRRFTAMNNRNETREILPPCTTLLAQGLQPHKPARGLYNLRGPDIYHELQQRAQPHLRLDGDRGSCGVS